MSNQQQEIQKVNSSGQERSHHDILASLAIADGLVSALELSHAQLYASYRELTSYLNSSDAREKIDEFEKHEIDCDFCLMRLARSVERLRLKFNNSYIEEKSGLKPQPEDKL